MRIRQRVVGWGKSAFEIGMDTFHSWSRHKIPMRAAAMSYYFLVTLAPLTLVLLYAISAVLGTTDPRSLLPEANVSDATLGALTQVVDVARAYSDQMASTGTLIAIGIALFGATVLLGNLTGTLDWIWDTTPTETGIRYFIRKRLLGVAGLFAIMGVALLIALVVNILNVLLDLAERLVDSNLMVPDTVESVLGMSWWIALAFVTVVLSIAFAWLPLRKIHVRDVLPGATITTAAYMVGQYALGIYLASSSIITAWGALGTFVAIVVWIYYTMQVVLAGAELTKQLVLRAEKRRGDAPSTTGDHPETSS